MIPLGLNTRLCGLKQPRESFFILLENNDRLLRENNDKILKENAV